MLSGRKAENHQKIQENILPAAKKDGERILTNHPWNVMKTGLIAFLACLALSFGSCKKEVPIIDIVDFEEMETGTSGVWNGSDGSGFFTSGNITFRNHYNNPGGNWSGFAYTSHTDTMTKDLPNEYSSIEGDGADSSAIYAVFRFSGAADTMFFDIPEKVTDIAFCNTVYSYYSMKYGRPFCRKFGGDSGSDPDCFRLTITAIGEDNQETGNAELYLADYRYSDNSRDYIANVWTSIDLSAFGFLKALKFEMFSSDSGPGGINNPAYVCVDNIKGELGKKE
jgi:hypothetical protein